jgi:cytochrome b561
MFASGLYMVNADISKADQFRLYQVHKASGVLVFLAIALRMFVRLFAHVPALPDQISEKDRVYAKWGHLALYAAMIIMPLSGWFMVSASPFGLPTIVFDWFEWPHIPGIERNRSIETLARTVHWYMAIAFITLVATHVFAVLKHKRIDKVNLLKRMWWSKHNEK